MTEFYGINNLAQVIDQLLTNRNTLLSPTVVPFKLDIAGNVKWTHFWKRNHLKPSLLFRLNLYENYIFPFWAFSNNIIGFVNINIALNLKHRQGSAWDTNFNSSFLICYYLCLINTAKRLLPKSMCDPNAVLLISLYPIDLVL